VRKRPPTHASEPPRPTAGLLAAIDALSGALARLQLELEAALQTPTEDVWIDQKKSPLTSRAHCKLTRELKRAGHPGAAITGKRHLLTQAAINEYLRGLPAPARSVEAGPGLSAVDRLNDDLIAEGILPPLSAAERWERRLRAKGKQPAAAAPSSQLEEVERELDIIFAEANRPLTAAERRAVEAEREVAAQKRRAYRQKVRERERGPK
jgi:hypothetical protein